MQQNIKLLLLLFLPLIFTNCEKDNAQAASANELLSNGDLEVGSATPDGWFRSAPCTNTSFEWTDEEAFSPKMSLKISNSQLESDCFSFWGQTFNSNIPTGKSLSLRVRIKGQLEGDGVSVAIRGDDTPEVAGTGEQFATTQSFTTISGTFNWTEYIVRLNPIEETIQSLTVYLVYLPNTTGNVYFDNISLTFK